MKYEHGRIVVTGAASGLGLAVANALCERGFAVLRLDITNGHDVRNPSTLPACPSDVVALINCAGINANDWFEDVTTHQFTSVIDTNAGGILHTSQWALDALKANKGTICNIVSNAAQIPMTSSLAYNASKAAALMMTKQMARELTKKYGITVFSVSPNKLEGTGMSKDIEASVQRVRGWTAEYAEQYQKAALLTGEETPPRLLAEFIGFLLSSKERHKYLAGCDLPYGA